MNNEYKGILGLPHTFEEGVWLDSRLSTLSPKETILLSAALQFDPPKTAADVVNLLLGLQKFTVLPASNYDELGDLYLAERMISLPDVLREHTDLAALGAAFERKHPGVFVDDLYVEYPHYLEKYAYNEKWDISESRFQDKSVRVKLASVSAPDGVWLRMPLSDKDHTEKNGETSIAFRELRVQSLNECTVLDVRCSFPAAGSVTEQYDRVEDLIRDASDFGAILERNTIPSENLSAAFEYEGCQTLRDALEITRNIDQYDIAGAYGLDIYARGELKKLCVPEQLVEDGFFDLEGFVDAWLRQQGYQPDSTGRVYIRPNENYQRQEQTASGAPELRM